jgi:hypothetical protein
MGISYLPNNSSGVAGGSADSSGLVTQVRAVAPERFDAGELVFMDWKTSDLKNLSGVPAAAALGAGPQSTLLTHVDFPTGVAGSGLCSANGLVLDDGSLVIFSGATSANGSPQWSMMTAFKYSPKGVLLSKTLMSALKGDATSLVSLVTCVVLSNGNIAASCTSYGAARWWIFSPSLQIIATGQSSGGTSGFGIQHLQPLNNGGFAAFGPGGIDTVSADGVLVNTVAIAQGYLAWQDEQNCNITNADVPQSVGVGGVGPRNYAPAKISNGGFGYVYWVANTVCYAQINADGTKRAEPLLLSALTGTPGSYFKFAVSTAGNICYAVTGVTAAGVYGVVSEAGVILKASTALANASRACPVYVVADAAGGFAVVVNSSVDSAAGSMYLKALTAAGADSGATKLLGASAYDRTVVLRLSTGTVVLWGNAQGNYTYQYALVTPAGVVKSGVLYNFGGGNSWQAAAAFVKDDKVYGALTSGASLGSGIPELVSFSITNAAVVTTQQYYLGVTNAGGSSSYVAVRIVLDYTGRYMHVFYGTTQGVAIVVVELSSLYMMNVYLPAIPGMANGRFNALTTRLRSFGQAILAIDADRTFPYGDNVNGGAYTLNMALVLKPQPTVLLGVNLVAVEKGDQMAFGTKGVFAVSPAWKQTVVNFDQSANTPPGNAGSLNNGIINLKGL